MEGAAQPEAAATPASAGGEALSRLPSRRSVMRRKRRHSRQLRAKGLSLLAAGACLGVLAFDLPRLFHDDVDDLSAGAASRRPPEPSSSWWSRRRLERSRREKNPVYVPDVFIRKKSRGNQKGNSKFVFLHAFGIIYMFLSLMVVCDNFFGPSLDCMVERWEIDDDVAGATFMAAGGSAPELATSYMGQFVSKSDIGFGTIVGSAVFNVLFVIACCALVVPSGCVQLTWWPLFRDCSCYIIGLLVLAMFVNANNDMVWYEALILFLGYIGYVTIMRYNTELEAFFASLFHAHDRHSKVSPTATLNTATTKGGGGAAAAAADGPLQQQHQPKRADGSSGGGEETTSRCGGGGGGREQSASLSTTCAAAAAAPPPPGTGEASSRTVEVKPASGEMPSGGGGGSGKVLPTAVTAAAHDEACDDRDTGAAALAAQEPDDDDDDDGGGGDEWENPWEWPSSRRERLLFVVTLPIKVVLYGTLPDCSRPDKAHLFKVTFAGSLIWLAVFAYGMVIWTTIVGATIGICDYVMGLTVLAAGTSIPDALSSMYMAREGRGDMAISSSIGSNVFDILVGLPVPVLTKYFFVAVFAKGSGEWQFDTESIVWDTVTLLLMVLAVVSSISYLGWVLNLKLGSIMFCLYFLFLISSISRNWKSCTGPAASDDDD